MTPPERPGARRWPWRGLSAVAALVAVASGGLAFVGGAEVGEQATVTTSAVRTVSITPDDRLELAMTGEYLPELSEAFVARVSLEAVEPAPPPAPEPVQEPIATEPQGGDSGAASGVWDALAQCESGGNWSIDTGNGFFGGLQFTLESWRWVGGTGSPHHADRETQIAMAERLLARQGWVAWPACSAKLGLR